MKRTVIALASVFALVSLGASAASGAEKAADKPAVKAAETQEHCAKAEKAVAGKTCCAAKGEKAAAAKCNPVSEKAVTLTGNVLCEHCDLHTAKSCNPVFKADGREGFLAFCPGTKDVDGIKAAGDHGKAKLEVKGKLCTMKDGKEVLMVESFAKKA